MQAGILAFLLGQFPGFVGIDVAVHLVAQQHDLAGGAGGVACFVGGDDGRLGRLQGREQGLAVLADAAKLAIKALGNEAGSARSDVYVFANQIGIDAQHEVFGVEVDVFVFAVEFCAQVVAQPLGVHVQAQVFEWVQARAPAFAHFFAVVYGHEAMHADFGGRFAAAEFQHGGPEQGVEGDDVFADEVDLLQGRVGHVSVVIFTALVQEVFQRGQVAHGRIQPHIKVFARRVGDFDAKVGRIARDVPVVQAGAGAAVGVGAGAKPFFDFGGHFGLHVLAVLRPFGQKFDRARVREFEEKVL